MFFKLLNIAPYYKLVQVWKCKRYVLYKILCIGVNEWMFCSVDMNRSCIVIFLTDIWEYPHHFYGKYLHTLKTPSGSGPVLNGTFASAKRNEGSNPRNMSTSTELTAHIKRRGLTTNQENDTEMVASDPWLQTPPRVSPRRIQTVTSLFVSNIIHLWIWLHFCCPSYVNVYALPYITGLTMTDSTSLVKP